MSKKTLKEMWLEYLTNYINELAYDEFEGFVEDNELSDANLDYIQYMKVKVVED